MLVCPTDRRAEMERMTRGDICPSGGREPLERRWFAIRTRSRHEKLVERELIMRQIDAFLPTVARWHRVRERPHRTDWPLFPGYCFARFDSASTATVLRCTGVAGVVSCAGRPAAVPDADIDSLRILTSKFLPCDPCPLLSEGDRIEVLHGPFRGVVGSLLRKRDSRAVVVISVSAIGQAVRIEVSAADVRPA
jgi:transcriptional antiterminator NusG